MKNCSQCGVQYQQRGRASLYCSDLCNFWNRTDKRSDSECWFWNSSLKNGYGQLRLIDGGWTYAHRLSWEINKGPIPFGKEVLHNCPGGDNKSCVNPAHLWIGTQKQNVHDYISKGRKAVLRGEGHPLSFLTDKLVRKIRRTRLTTGLGYRKLSKMFGLSRQHIREIVLMRIWKHVR